jgi:hypothetical protein
LFFTLDAVSCNVLFADDVRSEHGCLCWETGEIL